MKVALYGKKIQNQSFLSCQALFDALEASGMEVVIYNGFYQFLEENGVAEIKSYNQFYSHQELVDVDLLITFGGDGTFLEAVTFVRKAHIPIVGINSGRLGFLASIHQDEIVVAIDEIVNKRFEIRELTLLEVEAEGVEFDGFPYALNELAIHKRDSASMITIHAHINGEFLNSYWADGLLIATPTGSTAYSLSVGGPIVHPSSNSFIINAIAPHNLNVRPLIIPSNVELSLRVEGRGDSFLGSLDSKSFLINQSTEIKIRQADFRIKVIELHAHSFYSTLRNKLMWGADRRNC